MIRPIQLLDVVALSEFPPARNLNRGQVGTVVECLDANHFEIEFADNQGRVYAQLAVADEKLMIHHHQPLPIAS